MFTRVQIPSLLTILIAAAGCVSASDLGARSAVTSPVIGNNQSTPGLQAAVEPGTLTAGAWNDNQNFREFMAYREEVVRRQVEGLLPTSTGEHEAAFQKFSGDRQGKRLLDIALVLDTTASMGDELAYLQTEFLALTKAIEAAHANVQPRWSLVVYRDIGDAYVLRDFDFRASATEFRRDLAAQSAQGGGDFPEAPEVALARMTEFAWREDPHAARMAFWVADAPHHSQNSSALAGAIREAQRKGVHIYPVASSGIDELAELTMRSAAQLTGGRYLFLTDDSGVGFDHKEPTIPCYVVTRLDQAILRMIDFELTGRYRPSPNSEIIRTVGEPREERCVGDGTNVAAASEDP